MVNGFVPEKLSLCLKTWSWKQCVFQIARANGMEGLEYQDCSLKPVPDPVFNVESIANWGYVFPVAYLAEQLGCYIKKQMEILQGRRFHSFVPDCCPPVSNLIFWLCLGESWCFLLLWLCGCTEQKKLSEGKDLHVWDY